MNNVDFVKQLYANFSTGNVPAVLAAFDSDIQWNECKGMPFVEDDGQYVGPDAIVQNVFMKIPEHFDGFNIAVDEVFGADDKVVMVGYYQGTNKATGTPFKANARHVWTVNDGKISRFFQAVDTVTVKS